MGGVTTQTSLGEQLEHLLPSQSLTDLERRRLAAASSLDEGETLVRDPLVRAIGGPSLGQPDGPGESIGGVDDAAQLRRRRREIAALGQRACVAQVQLRRHGGRVARAEAREGTVVRALGGTPITGAPREIRERAERRRLADVVAHAVQRRLRETQLTTPRRRVAGLRQRGPEQQPRLGDGADVVGGAHARLERELERLRRPSGVVAAQEEKSQSLACVGLRRCCRRARRSARRRRCSRAPPLTGR